MPIWSIRPFAIDDYAAARTLWEASEGVGLDASDSRERIEAFLRRNPWLSAIAEADGAVIGAVLCGHDGRRGLIYHLAVAREHRRQGVGAALVAAALVALRAEGIRKCHVLVFADNDEANQFWRRQGAKIRTDLTLSTFTIEDAP
ncbi:MAG TPA: GNAT family N-acetyltransferase [Polyangia bacterium]|jgi:ribosomal protein S18 acetylase RimI-like enzyme|nr:GNAT family N-acetyltransferase [Polyangia bacterium]